MRLVDTPQLESSVSEVGVDRGGVEGMSIGKGLALQALESRQLTELDCFAG